MVGCIFGRLGVRTLSSDESFLARLMLRGWGSQSGLRDLAREARHRRDLPASMLSVAQARLGVLRVPLQLAPEAVDALAPLLVVPSWLPVS